MQEFKLFNEFKLYPRKVHEDPQLELIYIGNLIFDELKAEFRREMFFVLDEGRIGYEQYLKTSLSSWSTYNLRAGMVFTNPFKKSHNQKIFFSSDDILSVELTNDNFKKVGLISFLDQSSFPLESIKKLTEHNLDQPFFVGYTEEGIKVAVPNTLIAHYFYITNFSAADFLYHGELINVFTNVIELNGCKIIGIRDIRPNLWVDIEHFGHYQFTAGKASGYDILIRSVNIFLRDMLNAKKIKGVFPCDIEFKIPFDINVEFELEGDYISKDKFLAKNIVSIKPANFNQPLFDHNYCYFFDPTNRYTALSNDCQSFKRRDIKKRKPTYELEQNHNHRFEKKVSHNNPYGFKDFPVSNIINNRTLDFLAVKEQFNQKEDNRFNNFKKNIHKPTFLYSEDDHYNKILASIDLLDVKHSIIRLGDFFRYPFSNIDYPFNKFSRYECVSKALLVRMTFEGFEFVMLDFGSSYLTGIIQNFGKRFKYKNDARLIQFIKYSFLSIRYNWLLILDENLEFEANKNINEEIYSRFQIRVIKPINVIIDCQEPYKDLHVLIKSRLIFHSYNNLDIRKKIEYYLNKKIY